MKCEHPIHLKSGIVVPCGKCLLCLSHRRDEWSARLQLHTLSYDSMPLFVTLTYKPEMLVFGDGDPTLVKSDIRSFIKRIKDAFDLYNTDFSYFGCGEYGDKFDRPHFHLLLFGFPQLEAAFKRSVFYSEEFLEKFWHRDGKNLGFINVGRAEWSGVHYVTKYVLKYIDESYSGKESPFIVYSRGIGYRWLKSPECLYLQKRLHDFWQRFKNGYYTDPWCELDFSSPEALRDSSRDLLRQWQDIMPKLVCTTPQGNKIALPRYFRKKLIGSFENFSDSPFWISDHLKKIYETTSYIIDHGDYDRESEISYHQQVVDFAIRNIRKRLMLKNNPLKYETV